MKFSYHLSISLVLLFIRNNCVGQKDDLYLQTSEINNNMVHYNADKRSIERFYTPRTTANWWDSQGQNVYSSPEKRAKLLQLINDNKKELAQLNFDAISINGKADYILFNRNLDEEQYILQEQQNLYEGIKKYLPFEEKIFQIEKPRRRGIDVNGEAVAKDMELLRKELMASIGQLNKSTDSLDKKSADFATGQIKGMQAILKGYYNFYNGYDPMFTWWVPATYKETDSLLGVYAGLFSKKVKEKNRQKDDGTGIIGNPIGEKELIRQLQHEFIAYSPEELVAIANKEFAWCDAELLKASNEMGFGNNWKAAQEKVKNSFVPPGKQPEAMYDLYMQSVVFLKKNDLLTIPQGAEDYWTMYMMSPEAQRVNPFFLGGESLIVSYPTNAMSFDEKMMSMRGNNPHFSRATVHHELLAGHHLQQYMNGRYKQYRDFETPFWIEGNALYWEMLLWDMNFPRSAEDRIGMLFWRMHRCARIIFSLNYHLGKWTPQQCIDFLVDRVGHERANAEGEVRRSFTGSYGPLYQIAYMIGGLQFLALKKELVDSGKMTYRQYHDAILHENAMPIEVLRIILTDNKKVKADYKTNWRFYKL